MNLPYLQLYKGDFLRGNVSACSIAAQGLWLRLMILMHDSERPGYLCLNSLPIPSRIAAIKCAVSVDEYETLLAELMSVCAFSTSKEGIIFSPELVAEYEERAKNAERQRKFKEKKKGNAPVTGEVTEKKRSGNNSRADESSSISSSEKEKSYDFSKKDVSQSENLSRNAVNPDAERELSRWMEGVARTMGLSRNTLADGRNWESVCIKAIEGGYKLENLVAVIRTELDRLADKPQFFSPNAVLRQLQVSGAKTTKVFVNEFTGQGLK